MVNTGYNLVFHGLNDKGLALMLRGVGGSDLKHSDDARLHLGEACH